MKKLQDFTYNMAVNASAKETMKKISQVNLWWAKNFKGKAVKPNDEFSVHFGDTFVNFKISEFIPDKKIVWQVTDCNLHWIDDKKEWNNTEVIWNLKEGSGKTRIEFIHKGLTPESECYESCKPGWTGHLKNSLVNLIHEGKGAPE
jgi:Activator of Hsp90 ATPase homolog 1-like protein